MNQNSEPELWSLCPLCHKPNPKGTSFCKHCWAILGKVDNWVSYDEAQEISKAYFARVERNKLIKTLFATLIPVVVFISAIYTVIFYLTDIVATPVQEIDSNSKPGEWAMFHHDITHSGTAGTTDIIPRGTIKWSFSTDGAIHSSPAVAYDTVYFGSSDSKLYAVDIGTGEKKWEFKAGSWVQSSPAVVNEVVYFGSNDHKMYAVDAYNGKKIWDFKTNYPIMSSPAVADGIVYFGSDDYYIYALDAGTGEEIWRFKTNGLAKAPPTVANGIVYIGGGSDYLLALNASNGRLRLSYKAHYSVYSAAVVSDDTVYFCNTDGNLFAIDGKAKSWPREHEMRPIWLQLWVMDVPGVPEPPWPSGYLWTIDLVDRRRVSAQVCSSPVLDNNTIYIGVNENLVAVDLEEQQIIWKFVTGDTVVSSPALAGENIYVGSEDGRLYAINTVTGDRVWDILTGGEITSSPAVVDGVIYVGSHDGNLYAIE